MYLTRRPYDRGSGPSFLSKSYFFQRCSLPRLIHHRRQEEGSEGGVPAIGRE